MEKYCELRNAEVNLREVKTITAPFESSVYRFRKKFVLEPFRKAVLWVCGVGCARYSINGKTFTDDIFTAPVSDYRKTLWVNCYDVTKKLRVGENIFFAALGNGFANEGIDSVWRLNESDKRIKKQFFIRLVVDGKSVLETDDTWLCDEDRFTPYNEIRSGERVDYRFYDPSESTLDYDDGNWCKAVSSDELKNAKRRICRCEPIREEKPIKPVKMNAVANGVVFDFGRNVSGYVQLDYQGEPNERVKIEYAEDFDGENLQLHGLDRYTKAPFQTDEIICASAKIRFKPRFCYHGFRYVKVSGRTEGIQDIFAIRIRQSIARTSEFLCDNEKLNSLYRAAINSSYNNFFYAITDCPTREKLGWTNDAVVSMEQIATNFFAKSILKKWYCDILDTQQTDGRISAVAPAFFSVYDCGPIADLILFVIPDALITYYGDCGTVKRYYGNIVRYYRYAWEKIDSKDCVFSLYDWDGTRNLGTDKKFVEYFCALLMQNHLLKFSRLTGDDKTEKTVSRHRECSLKRLRTIFNGEAKRTATLLALAIVAELEESGRLFAELKEIVLKNGEEAQMGAFGLQHFFKACEAAGQETFAVEYLLNEEGMFGKMIKYGDTLWECADLSADRPTISMDHHMYSSFSTLLTRRILGLERTNGKICFAPTFIPKIKKVEGSIGCGKRKVTVKIDWDERKAVLKVPVGVVVQYKGTELAEGERIVDL